MSDFLPVHSVESVEKGWRFRQLCIIPKVPSYPSLVSQDTDISTCSGGVAIFVTTFHVMRGMGRFFLGRHLAAAGRNSDWNNRWAGANGHAEISWVTLTQRWLADNIANNE